MQKTKASLFVGYKSSRAIPLRAHLQRDYLVQLTLDSAVRRIEYHPSMRGDGNLLQTDAIIFDSDFGRYAVDLVDARPDCDPNAEHLLDLAFAEECDGIVPVTDADIRQEPRFSGAREIWRHRRVTVHTNDREAVLGALSAEGPVPIRSLGGLADTIRNIDTVVYALACDGALTVDLNAPLDDRSIVRLGPVAGRAPLLAYGT